MSITTYTDFLSRPRCAEILRSLFDRRALWERRHAELSYRNGAWYTLGASIYLDLNHPREYPAFVQKTKYFNGILLDHFDTFYVDFKTAMYKQVFARVMSPLIDVMYLNDKVPNAPYPGFHIFPPEETLSAPFGKIHQDLQHEALIQIPGFPWSVKALEGSHFTFTLPLALPYQGGGMFLPDETGEQKFHMYEEGNLCFHSGQFPHMVLPFKAPVTPLDWRITFQGHGFLVDQTAYLYW